MSEVCIYTAVLKRKKINIGKGSSYYLSPIPAKRHLIANKEYKAARVLDALCLHLGRGENWVQVSYDTLEINTGMARKSVSSGIKTLEALCIIGVKRSRQSRDRANTNEYFIQDYAYNSKIMKQISNGYFPMVGMCQACFKNVYAYEIGRAVTSDYHRNCGGEVHVPGAKRQRIINLQKSNGKVSVVEIKKYAEGISTEISNG